MSSHEPDPDDAQTGPVPLERTVPASGPAGQRRYDAPLSVQPRPVRHDRRPAQLVALAVVVVVALGGLAWFFWPSSQDDEAAGSIASGTPRSTTAAPPEDTEAAVDRLRAMLPRGYPDDACSSVAAPEGAEARISCTKNDDPGGPLSATYTLAADKQSLEAMFDRAVDELAVVNCPGNIQSPGPWRRNATPQQVAGILVCGFDDNTSTVAWTTSSLTLMSEIQSGPQGPNMVQLYAWWSSHS